MPVEALLISVCLLGANCKYSGGNNQLDREVLRKLRGKYRLIPVCPEVAGGLTTPRDPSERRGDRVISSTGQDVTAYFQKGAETACILAGRYGCCKALLKANSPSCGSGQIYDGSFSGSLIHGDGVTGEALKKLGITIYTEKGVERLL